MALLEIAAFRNRKQANDAILELEEAGVPHADFSIIGQEETQKKDSYRNSLAESAKSSRSSGSSATVSGAVGGLDGLIAGAIATTGMFIAGPVVLLAGLGWIVSVTVTSGAVGTAAGGIVGAFVGLGIPEEKAKHHESVLMTGGIILGVEDNEVTENEIRSCFENHGAEEIVIIEHINLPARVSIVTT